MKSSKHVLLSLVLCCAYFLSFSQPLKINETFNQPVFFASNMWIGSIQKFQHLDDKMVSASTVKNDEFYVSHPFKKSDGYEFSIDVNLALATSSANYVDLLLTANDSNLTDANQSLFLRIGDTKDEIKLVQSTGGVEEVLMRSNEKITHSFDGTVLVKTKLDTLIVSVQEISNVVLWSDTMAGIKIDSIFYVGLVVKQSTSSFHQKHSFDNWYVGPERRDTNAPFITDIFIKRDSSVVLVFNEPVDSSTISKTSFSFQQSLMELVNVSVNQDTITLFYNHHFTTGKYTMQLSHVSDMHGNELLDTIIFVNYREIETAKYRDVILTEIMSDPSPSVDLPEYEYIEIVNRSNSFFDLSDWKLYDASKYCSFSSYILPPDSFLIICDAQVVSFFQSFGAVLGVTNFVSLNNASDSLTLVDDATNVIDFVYYNEDWHFEEWKKEGGWSLEIQNSSEYCIFEGNWISSVSNSGGTPGQSNSVASNFRDEQSPQLVDLFVEPNTLSLVFSESIETYSAQLEDFQCDLEIVNLKVTTSNTVKLTFDEALDMGKAHYVIIDRVHDCSGNFIQTDTVTFGIPSIPEQHDLIINEIMFEPAIDGVEFIELYNSSNSLFNLSDLTIGAPLDETSWQSLKKITEQSIFIEAGSFKVLTKNCAQLKKDYPTMNIRNCVQTQNVHQLSNELGAVGIGLKNGLFIDMLFYDKEFHFPLLTETKGVSLERRSYADSTNSSENWTSASSSQGYGTPGNLNSQFIGIQSDNETRLRYDPISPNGDGFNDVLVLENSFMDPNTVVDLQIFDLAGRLIAYPVNKNIVGYRNQFIWEGIIDNGSIIREGIYVVQLKSFTPQNGEIVFRAPFTVTN